MDHLFRILLVSVFVGVLPVSCADDSAASEAAVLTFSAIPDHDETELRAKYAPVATWLSETLGVEVRYHHCAEYKDAVELFKNGDVQLAWFGGLSGVKARHAVAGARAIAQGVEDPEFYSYFIAHEDSGLQPGDEFPHALAGKKFRFGSDGSTSGRLMPEHFIRKFGGKSPQEFFGSENSYSKTHTETCKLVASGEFDAGACNFKTYDTMVAKGEIDPETCFVLWKTPTYADYNLTAHPLLEERFGAGFVDRVRDAFLQLTDPQLLRAFEREKFIAAENEDFDAIKELAIELDLVR